MTTGKIKKNNFKIGIIGQGFVGSAIREGLKDFYTVRGYDLDPEKCFNLKWLNKLEEVANHSDIVFVCVPTPMRKDGSCDTRILENAIKELDEACASVGRISSRPVVVIKSTIPPGTTDRIRKKYVDRKEEIPDMHICFSPEFLTEANSFDDFKNQTRIIVGGDESSTDMVKKMFEKVFSNIPIVKTNTTTAEMVKYFINCFLATKVTFANQMFQICLDNNINFADVVDMSLLDKRIGKSHLTVPGPDGDLGFGGHCFPKDLAAMISFGSIENGDTSFLSSVQAFNDKVRMIRDWEAMKGRAISED